MLTSPGKLTLYPSANADSGRTPATLKLTPTDTDRPTYLAIDVLTFAPRVPKQNKEIENLR